MEGVETWRGGWGGLWGACPTHQSGPAERLCSRAQSGPGAGLGVAWRARGSEQDCSPSPNDRANCTLYKSLWPINTTSTHIKSTHMHIYSHTKSLTDCVHLCSHVYLPLKLLVNLTIHILTHTWQSPELGRGEGTGSVVVTYRAHLTGCLDDEVSLLPAFPSSLLFFYNATSMKPPASLLKKVSI